MKSHKGTALLTTLLVMSFAAMTLMVLINIQQILTFSSAQFFENQTKYHEAMGVEDWAASELIQYISTPKEEKVAIVFPRRLPPTKTPVGLIAAELQIADGAFNINNVLSSNAVNPQSAIEDFVHGLTAAIPSLVPNKAEQLYQYLQTYLLQENYQGTNYFLSTTELPASHLLVPQEYEELNTWMTALPDKTQANFNALVPESLVMLTSGKIDLQTAKNIIKARNDLGWVTDLTPLQENSSFGELSKFTSLFTFESQYFWLLTVIKSGKISTILYTLIKAEGNNSGKVNLSILWRSYGNR